MYPCRNETVKYIDELYLEIEKKDNDVIQSLCSIFVNWTIHYAKIVYSGEWMPFEEYMDNVTAENLQKLSDNAYLSACFAPDDLAHNCATYVYVSNASDYAAKRILPGVGKCMGEAAKLAKRWVGDKVDYEKESEMIKIFLLESALGVRQ